MKIQKLRTFILTSFCLAVISLILPAASNAQGRYTGKYSKRDVSNIIATLEQSSNTFRRDFDRYLDESSINNTNEEDRLNRIVRNYENALDRLRREYDRTDNWWQSRANVQDVMSEARQVNVMMNSLSFARKLERQWNNMRRDINKLADTYDLPDLSGGGGGGGGIINNNVPKWALGNFYARNPQTGGTIMMTINSRGYISVDFDGGASSAFGTFNKNNTITIDGITARVTKLNNGIRTTRTDNGERIDYYRTDTNTNPGGGGGNVSSWAIGTFYGRNPQTGGQIVLTIDRNGSVTVNAGGGLIYGTVNGDRLTINGLTSQISRLNNGIRTTRTDNGERIDYYRDGNNNNNNNTGGNVPNWALGTFYGRNPQNGSTISLTIQSNGSVTVSVDGGIIYGTINGETLTINGATSRVRKISNGISTTRTDNGERIDYRRQ